jgi:FkbM family methyltransferase
VEPFILLEVFVGEDYCFEHLSDDALIIDVGAYVGDTALYFASKGYNVIAFEPVPELYNTAKKNLELNPKLSKKIKLINKAISGKKGTRTIRYSPDALNISQFYSKLDKEQVVETTTLQEVLDNIPEDQEIGLKLDCEGCEYEAIEKTNLSRIKEIILEYHPQPKNKTPKDITNKLKKENFKIKIIKGNYEIGIIHAYQDTPK